MQSKMDDLFPIYDIISDAAADNSLIIGKNGSLTYCVKLSLPEVYSLSKEDIEKRHSQYIQAFSNMPDSSYVHKQDTYIRNSYDGSETRSSYLSKAENEHFLGREYMKHTCILAFTLANLTSLSKSYTQNVFAFRKKLEKNDSDRVDKFLSAVDYALNNLRTLRGSTISYLSVNELKDYIFSTVNYYDSAGIKDLHFERNITSNNIISQVYAITDIEQLPDTDINVSEKDFTVSIDKSELYMSIAESFGGIHLRHNHVYNQILYFYSDTKLKELLSENLETHMQNKDWDKTSIVPKIEKLTELGLEIKTNHEILCYAHYSVVLFDSDEVKLHAAEKDLRSILDVNNIKYYVPSYGNLVDIFAGNIIGATASLDKQYMFITSLSLACCFITHYSTFTNDEQGVYFNDRLFQIPLRKDIWDAKNNRLKARNAVVVAPTGGGKSFITNNIVYQLLDAGYTVVAVEFGNSFKQLCNLYPDISIHIEYDQNQPLGINPFDIDDNVLSPDKEEMLISLCLKFWRQTETNANTIVALRKFLSSYFKECRDSLHSFQGFYQYLKEGFTSLCKELLINEDYFDIRSFLHVCSEFMPGGSYANLCAMDGVASNLSEKRFIHFELTKVKSSPFVASIVMSLLFDIINNKILSDPSKKGYIIFDEYAETAQMKSASSLDVNIHQTVAFFFQKIRKENGAVMIIIQSPVQLPENEYTKGIIANTQLLYVLEGTEVVYDAIIETFKIKNKAHVSQMKSIQNNYSCQRPYSECWIRFGEIYALTVRLEASPAKYLAFQTQGEIRYALDKEYERNGNNMELAIENYLKNNN